MLARISGLIADLYQAFRPQLERVWEPEEARRVQKLMNEEGDGADLAYSPRRLCALLSRPAKRNAIVLIDEYDTPLQGAWLEGYWNEASLFFRGLFNSTLKTNPYLERSLITNLETRISFDGMVRRWFAPARVACNGFVRALLAGDLKAMNAYMNDVTLDTFGTFDTGRRPSGAEPERFFRGFVLGLLVELRERYQVRSNRGSGYGRYDVMLVSADPAKDLGIVMKFKVRDAEDEGSLEDTAPAALAQIEERRYAAELVSSGLPEDRVRCYGLAFEGKRVLIGR